MNNQKIVVNNIIGEADANGYIRVTLAYNLFNLLRGARPVDLNNNPVPFTEQRDEALQVKNRLFVINGVSIHSNYNTKDRKTIFIMQEKDAKAYHIPLSQQATQQLSELSASPFNLSDFQTDTKEETKTEQTA